MNVRSGSFASTFACPQHVQLWCNLRSADHPVLTVEDIGLIGIQAGKRQDRITDADRHDTAVQMIDTLPALMGPRPG